MVKKNLRDLIGYGAKGKKISWPNNAILKNAYFSNSNKIAIKSK